MNLFLRVELIVKLLRSGNGLVAIKQQTITESINLLTYAHDG